MSQKVKKLVPDVIPFGKFLQLQSALERKDGEVLSKEVEIASILTDKSIDEVMETFTLTQLTQCVQQAGVLLAIPKSNVLKQVYTVGGAKYSLASQVSQWTSGRFIDFSHVGSTPDNPHLLVAVVLTPLKGKYGDKDIQELAQEVWDTMPAWEALQILDFFTKTSIVFLKIIEGYLGENPTMKGKMTNKMVSQLVLASVRGGDGI